jgi:hypothetical protein
MRPLFTRIVNQAEACPDPPFDTVDRDFRLPYAGLEPIRSAAARSAPSRSDTEPPQNAPPE